ncbi:MAG TPA: hypothetical protein VN380_07070 [Thermoanaerobaculia bacterium]|nr:hypothetical protein [Thermoanaerobaculia bacterium]
MKKISLVLLLLLALLPMEAKAFNTYDSSDVLSYVAMPLAVSAVCDVRGVQTDRVGELVSYMDQANVPPADFIDVFRYVPVALVLRTDNRPDFVEWVHGQVDRGVVGQALVTSMESRLRTFDNYVPAASYRMRRHFEREPYAYAYEDDYVPVEIRRHCDRLILDPLTLVEMPLAVADVYDLGVPYDRVNGLVVELNLGDVAPLQFVELMRYAPAALVINGDYYGQPDFVQYVRRQRADGLTGYLLVQNVGRQLQVYGVAPQIDYGPPLYGNQTYYAPQTVQYYVPPLNAAYVPPLVQSRVATNFAAARTTFNQPAPAMVAPSQVQRLLASPDRGAVVANPGQARRELARANRAEREAPIAAVPAPFAGSFAGPGRIEDHGHRGIAGQQPVISAPVVESANHGNGRGHGRQSTPVLTPMISSAPASMNQGHEHGQGRDHAAVAAAPPFVAAPQAPHQERGRGHAAAPSFVAAPAATPAPLEHGHGRDHGGQQTVAVAPATAPAPVPQPVMREEHGHGHGQPAVVAAPAQPTATAVPQGQPPAGPPGHEKKKEKGKDQ